MHLTRRKFLVGCLVVAGGFALGLAFEHVRGRLGLRSWRATLIARGEKMSLAGLVPPPATNRKVITPDETAALLHLSALETLPYEFRAKDVVSEPGQARAVWGAPSRDPIPGRTNTWAELAGRLAPLAPDLEAVHAQLARRNWEVAYDYEAGADPLRPGYALQTWTASLVLATQAQFDLQQQHLDAATDHLQALLLLPGVGIDGRGLGSPLRSATWLRLAAYVTWQWLQAPGSSDPQLAALQLAWDQMRPLDDFILGLQVERVVVADYWFGRWRVSRVRSLPAFGLSALWAHSVGQPPSRIWNLIEPVMDFAEHCRSRAFALVWRAAWLDQAELRYSQDLHTAVEYARYAAGQRSLAAAIARWGHPSRLHRTLELSLTESLGLRSRYDRIRFQPSLILMSPVGSGVAGACEGESTRSLVLAALALRRHQLRHGRLPSSLNALVPEFLKEVPRDYLDGEPLRYRLAADGTFTLYAVGEDGQDDGGDPRPRGPLHSQPDTWAGRDWVWPQPAPPDRASAARVP